MGIRSNFVHKYQVVPSFAPTDINTTPTADWINLEGITSAVCYLYNADVAAVVTWTFNQATANDDTGAKSLPVIDRYYLRSSATAAGLLTETTFTEQTQTAATSIATATGTTNIIIVEFDPALLDGANGYTHIRVAPSDPGATCIASAWWFLEARFGQASMITAID